MFETIQVKCREFRPLQDWVLMEPPVQTEKKSGGIVLAHNPRDYCPCPIVAVGPKCELKVGETVWIQRFATAGDMRFKLNGRPCFLIREQHINCVLSDPKVDSKGRKGKKAA